MIVLVLGTAAAALYFWAYGGYPEWIRRRAGRAPAPASAAPARPTVEVLVAAADEAAVIEERLRNLLAQDYDVRRLSIAVGCDGCTDATGEIARRFGSDRVRVLEFGQRRGKAAILNDLVAGSSAEILVFTDANTHFENDAVVRLAERFGDPSVGVVCGRLVLRDWRERADRSAPAHEPPFESRRSAESLYWDRESSLKQAEGRFGLCLGANGAIYAARRELVRPLPPSLSAMDDFLVAAQIARGGAASVFEPAAVAVEPVARRLAEELRRRWRIGVGAGRVMIRAPWLWTGGGRKGLAAIFFGRKASRWLAPVLLMLACGGAALDSRLRPAGLAGIGAAAVLFAAVPLVGKVPSRRFPGAVYYFLVTNLVLGAGVAAGLMGVERATWRRTSR
jgi:cellulose synthase/poly-beta-1,6-N-acetylglucosamine synthase-like glycosyltransferase